MFSNRIDSQSNSYILYACAVFIGYLSCQSLEVIGDTENYWPDDPLVAEATARIKPRKP